MFRLILHLLTGEPSRPTGDYRRWTPRQRKQYQKWRSYRMHRESQRNRAKCTREYLWRHRQHKCGICKGKIDRIENAEVDHIIPIARGGQHRPRNVQLTHRACNQWKGARIL